MKFIHNHYLPPMLIVCQTDGQKYLCPSWQKVPMETSISDIEWINPYRNVSQNCKLPVGKEWIFSSVSRPGIVYTVQIINKQLICSCPGSYRSRTKECKHIKAVKSEIANKK